MNSNDRFKAILQRVQETHDKKGADYGTDKDGLANIRQASDFGMEPWVGAILRANDKMMRLKTFVKKGKLVNESVKDSLLDLAVYTIIAMALYEQTPDTCGCREAGNASFTCAAHQKRRLTYGEKYGMTPVAWTCPSCNARLYIREPHVGWCGLNPN